MSKHQKARQIAAGLTKGMVNAYICPDLHSVVTKNLHDGALPIEISCPQCQQPAMSMMYQVNQNLPHRIEWFRPTEAEMQAASLSMSDKQAAGHRDYVINQKGLISRIVPSIKPA